jgi:hypothetical protein
MGEPERNQNPKRLVHTEKEQIAMATKTKKNETLTTTPEALLTEYTAKLVDVMLKLKPAESQKDELRKQMLQHMKDNQLTEFQSNYGKVVLNPEKQRKNYNVEALDALINIFEKIEEIKPQTAIEMIEAYCELTQVSSHIAFHRNQKTQVNELTETLQPLLKLVEQMSIAYEQVDTLTSEKNQIRNQIWSQMHEHQLDQFVSNYGKIILVPEKERVFYDTQKVDTLLELLKKSEATLQGKWIATLLKQARQSMKIRSHIAFYPQTETN